MRLALVFFSLNVRGGSAAVFLSLAKTLQELGLQVDVYTYYFSPEDCFPELMRGLPVSYVKKIGKNFRVSRNFVNRAQLMVNYYWRWRWLYWLMKGRRYDAILASEAIAYLPALAHKKDYGTPVFWSVFDPLPLIWEKSQSVFDWPSIDELGSFFVRSLMRAHAFFDRRNVCKIDRVIVPTHAMQKAMDQFYGIDSLILPLAGVRGEEYQTDKTSLILKRLRERFGFTKQNERIVFSNGHFLPHRWYEDSLQAIKKLLSPGNIGPIKYIISGSCEFDPQYYNKIKGIIRRLDLDNYVLIDDGFKTNAEMVGYYQYCDIFLSTNVGQTWGLSPFEAMMAQKAVIVTNAMGCSEVIKDGKQALVVEQENPQKIAKALEKLLLDQNLRELIAKGGYELAAREFTYKKRARELVKFLNDNLELGES